MEDRAELQLGQKNSSFISRIFGCLGFDSGQELTNYDLQVNSDLRLFLETKFYQNTATLVVHLHTLRLLLWYNGMWVVETDTERLTVSNTFSTGLYRKTLLIPALPEKIR